MENIVATNLTITIIVKYVISLVRIVTGLGTYATRVASNVFTSGLPKMRNVIYAKQNASISLVIVDFAPFVTINALTTIGILVYVTNAQWYVHTSDMLTEFVLCATLVWIANSSKTAHTNLKKGCAQFVAHKMRPRPLARLTILPKALCQYLGTCLIHRAN